MDADIEALYGGLERAGPGSAADTLRALALCGVSGPVRVLDIGCGPGAASLVLLAALPEATVTATDLFAPFLADAERRVAAAGEAARFRTVEADMAALPFAPGSFDLLWCEGAAYIIGVPQALAAWRGLLAPGGRLAFSEAVWLTETPAPRARAMFEGYAAMTDVAGVRARIAAAGWRLLGDFVLSPAAWQSYYGPLEARARTLDADAAGRRDAGGDRRLAGARGRLRLRLLRGRAVTDAAVAGLVERGDPERWRSAMTAPPAARPGLMALYAFNLEVARAPWVASEPGIAAIRLRWWLDAVAEIYDGRPARRHEVVEPLALAIRAGDLPRRLFEEMIEARVADAEAAPHRDRAALDLYIDHTAGHLMELAARHLGAEGAALPVVRDFARGAGTAALLRALPELRARGRDPLPPDVAVDRLAGDGLAALARARGHRRRVPREAAPALLAGWQAGRALRRAAADPAAAERPGGLDAAEAVARAGLLWRAFSGRW